MNINDSMVIRMSKYRARETELLGAIHFYKAEIERKNEMKLPITEGELYFLRKAINELNELREN